MGNTERVRMTALWRNFSGDLVRKPDDDLVRQAACPDCDCLIPCSCPCGTYPPASWPCGGLLETYSLTAFDIFNTLFFYHLRIDPALSPVTLTAYKSCGWRALSAPVQYQVNDEEDPWFDDPQDISLSFSGGVWRIFMTPYTFDKSSGCDPTGNFSINSGTGSATVA